MATETNQDELEVPVGLLGPALRARVLVLALETAAAQHLELVHALGVVRLAATLEMRDELARVKASRPAG